MEIRFSRHAKRRARLYNISEHEITSVLQEKTLDSGLHEVIVNIDRFRYPLKIVIAVENDIITVITNYPLMKG